ncbi:MAG: hypothetical protein QXH55_00265 [Candidatus Korarchaeota archaeon]|nr:hypothetical protein [Thermoproteota archaeon]MCR8462583.1 hypothetical protein [Thermoproteota archaeon]MCR8470689.1 hypothetical protein [Thermoproteota archaeon]MCR8471711.1 hypothetical protein [Thermoproteota archaeon]MCR8472912.1 hypothetical protein [Thermoproteota archaeon]
MDKLFGTSGIRGSMSEITPEFSAKLGLCAAAFYDRGSTVIVARDHRPHAQIVEMALISGLIAGGVNVLESGVSPTPAVLWAIKEFKADGAIVVTGSHTPPEIVGILFFKNDTSELDRDEEKTFEEMFLSERYTQVPWNEVGDFEYVDVREIYIERVLGSIKSEHICDSRVVIDPGNGAASGILKEIVELAGADVIAINDTLDPRFPKRDPFPRPENLAKLGALVKSTNADLGVATDGDGDRAIFAGDDGRVYWGDISSAMFAIDGIKNRNINSIVVTINTSSIVEIVARKFGGKVHYCDVGPPSIASKMKETASGLGLEESGKYIWSDCIFYGDAALSTLRMLEFLKRTNKSFSDIVQELPKRYLMKIAIDCPNEIKSIITRELEERIGRLEIKPIRQLIKIHNGFKVIFCDDSWLLFRPSGTEPKYRIHSESSDEEDSKSLISLGFELVSNIIKRHIG